MQRLKAHQWDLLDLPHLPEEIESLDRQEQEELARELKGQIIFAGSSRADRATATGHVLAELAPGTVLAASIGRLHRRR